MLTALLCTLATGCGTAARRGDTASAPQWRARPAQLALIDPQGRSVDLTSFRGRAVLIVAIRLDDLKCQAMLRNIEPLVAAHPEDLVAVAVAGDDYAPARHREMAAVYARVLELQRTHLVLADDNVRAGRSALGPVEAVPTTYLVNRAGSISQSVVGYLTQRQLAALVAPALPPRPAPAAP